jgi:hypothetical protein
MPAAARRGCSSTGTPPPRRAAAASSRSASITTGRTGRDIDYVVSRSAAGDALIALLADEVEPTVVVRRYSNGDTDLLTSFEM